LILCDESLLKERIERETPTLAWLVACAFSAKRSATGGSVGVRVGSVASVVELSLALAKASRAVSATIPRAPLLSRRGGGFGCRRWFRRCRRACFLGVTFVEAINAPGGIYQFLFARKTGGTPSRFPLANRSCASNAS
jgi:hypothetical protein